MEDFMKYFFLFILLGWGFFPALGQEQTKFAIDCKAYGELVKNRKLKTIVEGSLTVDTSKIGDNPLTEKALQQERRKYAEQYAPISDGLDRKKWVDKEGMKWVDEKICIPVGQRSKLFGPPGGSQLQISAWRCHNGAGKPYFNQMLFLNGKRISTTQDISPNTHSRLMLGLDRVDILTGLVVAPSPEDLQPKRGETFSIPEGEFTFVYFDCSVKQSSE